MSKKSKAYKLFDPITKKITISRDVKFEENACWKWEQSKGEVQSNVLDWEDKNSDANKELDLEEDFDSNNTSNIISQTGGNSSTTSSGGSEPNSPKGRCRRAPAWVSEYTTGEGISEEEEEAMMMITEEDPITYNEAMKEKKWRDAMAKEIDSIEKNGTWRLTTLPSGVKAMGVKWVFKTKLNEHGNVEKHKARLVAKGYAQQYGIDYIEVFAPVARLDTIRLILATAAQNKWEVYQLDVKSAFLQGELKEEVYLQQPIGFEKKGEEEKVYKLNKALYGLKQAPREWYSRIESYFVRECFERCASEHTLFTKEKEGGKILIVSLYVDDLIYTGNNKSICEEFKMSMMHEFDMSDLGKMSYFLGMEII